MSLIAELKRRNVFKVAVSYAVVGWLIAQLAEFTTSTFGAPDWVLPTFVMLLFLGLPIAVILAWAFDLTPEGVRKTPETEPAGRSRRGTNWIVLLLLGIVLATAVVLQFWAPQLPVVSSSPSSKPAIDSTSWHVDVAFSEETQLAFVGAAPLGYGRHAFTLSPDGQRMVFVGSDGDGYALFIRDFTTREIRRLAGTENGFDPFFSPNGRWVAFFSDNLLKRVSPDGGTAVTMTEATNSAGGTWLGNDTILAFVDEGTSLLRYSFDGTREEWRAPVPGSAPYALPGRSRVLWSMLGGNLVAYDLESGEAEQLPITGSDPRYFDGLLFFSQGSSLYVAGFDPEAAAIESNPAPVQTAVRMEVDSFAQWSLAANGNFLYAPGNLAAQNPLIWVDGDVRQTLELPQRLKGTFEISPDGEHLAVLEQEVSGASIWLYDLAGGRAPRKLSVESDIVDPLVWLPGAEEIVFHRQIDGLRSPFVLSLNSSAPGRALLDGEGGNLTVPSVSSDGRLLGIYRRFSEPDQNGQAVYAERVAVVDRAAGTETEIPVLGTGNWGVAVSPDGRWVAYTSPVSGEYQNYLQPFPPTGARYQISRVGGAEEPRWSRDSRHIYYRSGQRIMVVDLETDPEFILGEPRVFHAGDFVNVSGRSYDISPDGSRALIIAGSEDRTRSIRMITHWLDRVQETVDAQR
jgi:serine/threonine-protein kinase